MWNLNVMFLLRAKSWGSDSMDLCSNICHWKETQKEANELLEKLFTLTLKEAFADK